VQLTNFMLYSKLLFMTM